MRIHTSQADGLCIVKSFNQVADFTPATEVIERGLGLNGTKVFIPKSFFEEKLLPKNHETMLGYV